MYHRVSIKYLSSTYRVSIGNHQLSIEYLSSIYIISINTCVVSTDFLWEYLSSVYRASINYLPTVYQVHSECLSSTYWAGIIIFWNIYNNNSTNIDYKISSTEYRIRIDLHFRRPLTAPKNGYISTFHQHQSHACFNPNYTPASTPAPKPTHFH